MENNNLNDLNTLDSSASVDSPGNKKSYSAPKLHHYGGLAELVQFRPDRGRDGETRWTDCTSG